MSWSQKWNNRGGWQGGQAKTGGGGAADTEQAEQPAAKLVTPPKAKGGAAVTGKGGAKVALKVSTPKTTDPIPSTLMGDYTENEENHGKPSYKKISSGKNNPDVFLYYWDNRDGAEYAGWWFGDQVGGDNPKVWARASVHTALPPKAGWRIPWDAPKIEPNALSVEPVPAAAAAAAPAASEGKAGKGGTPATKATGNPAKAASAVTPAKVASTPAIQPADRAKKATEAMTSTESAVNVAITNAKKVIENTSAPESQVKAAMESLARNQTKLNELQKSMAEDMVELRKAGPSGVSHLGEVQKLLPKIKTLLGSINAENIKIKGMMSKIEAEKKKKEEEAKAKAKEASDSKEFKAALPKLKAAMTKIEAAIGKVESSAAKLVETPPEGEELTKKQEGVEKAAEEALKQVQDLRTDVNAKNTAARQYAPEAKKEALAELGPFQQKLAETQKKLSAYKDFKKHFAARVEAAKTIAEVKKKSSSASADITKVSNLVKEVSKGQMTEEEIAEADKIIASVKEGSTSSAGMIASKMRGADPVTAAELTKLQKQNAELKEKLEAVNTRLKAQREVVTAPSILAEAKEKVSKLESCMTTCQDVEMPFLKGMEVLPKEESDTALAESEKAAQACTQALSQAKSFVTGKQAAAKTYTNKEIGESITEQLVPLVKRIDTVDQKLKNFKTETAERKMNAIIAPVVEAVVDAEKKASAMVIAGKPLAADKVDGADVEAIKEAIEKAESAGKEASAACAEVKKSVASKQSQTQSAAGKDAMNKVNGRLKVAQEKIDKTKQAIMTAQRLIKAKEILEREGAKLDAAEADVEKAEAQTKSGPPSEDGCRIIEESAANAKKILATLPAVIKPQLGLVPVGTKEKLQAMIDRITKAQETVEKLKKSTEKERGEVFVKDAETKTSAVEDVMAKVSDLELPYLKGIEVLPLDETLENISQSEDSSKEAQEKMKEATAFMTGKTLELKTFAEAKPITEAFAKCKERIESAQQKLTTFKKETEGRKKGAMVQKAGVMVDELEALVKNVTEASEPFAKEDADKMTEAEAKPPLEKYLDAEKDASKKLNEARQFVKDRQLASKGIDAQLAKLKEYTTKITEAQQEISKAKKVTGVHEQRFLAAHLLEEVKPQVEALDGEVKKATDACAPLLEDGGEEYLVLASIRTLATALTAHAKDKELDMAALFKEASGGKKKVPEEKFLKYLADLPAKISHDEIAFSEERRLAIFKVLDADKDGGLISAEFEAMFKQKASCSKEVSLTETSAVDGETVCKVAPGTELELFGLAKVVDEMNRTQCKLADGKSGWITIKGNQGSPFVFIKNPFDSFVEELNKVIRESGNSISKFQTFLSQKIKEASHHPSGPVTEALTATKVELEKFRPQIGEKNKALEELKKKVVQAKSTFKQKETAEKNAHIELREKKEAAEIIGDADPKVEAIEPLVSKVEEEAKSILGTEKDDLVNFTGPATALDAVKKAAAAALEATEAAKVIIKEKIGVANEIKPPTKVSGMAKRQLQLMLTKVDQAAGKCRKAVAGVKGKCEDIVVVFSSQVSKALRVAAQKKNIGVEKFFDELAKGSDMSEATFCKTVQKLEGVEVQAEHARLLFASIAKASVLSKRRFLTYVQMYYVTVKDIAFSDIMDISTCKTLRKAEKDEMLEVLEGPVEDEKTGIVRVRAKSVLDSTEGWITVKGNQGTPFLKECAKVYYCVKKPDVALQKETGGVTIRTLKEEEILELIGGPREVEVAEIQRGRLKADKDQKQGWITLTDQNGVTYASNTKLYTCKASVAMTDGEDINACKVIRKLEVGEQFEASGSTSEDASRGITRLPGKALKDGKEGWITTHGNAGTVYAEADNTKYVVEKAVQLQDKYMSVGAKNVRKLEVGEGFVLLEGPREEKAPPEFRVKVRCLSDGTIGWVSKQVGGLKNASTSYRCVVETSMSDSRAGAKGEGSKVLRDFTKGEVAELIEGPVEEGKELRIKVAAKDGLIGWVTLKNEEGKKVFE